MICLKLWLDYVNAGIADSKQIDPEEDEWYLPV